jgi:NADH-quinone oxidoreductase subunit H
MMSYELAIGVILATLAVIVGSLNLVDIVNAQRHIWFIVPLWPLLFNVYFFSFGGDK